LRAEIRLQVNLGIRLFDGYRNCWGTRVHLQLLVKWSLMNELEHLIPGRSWCLLDGEASLQEISAEVCDFLYYVRLGTLLQFFNLLEMGVLRIFFNRDAGSDASQGRSPMTSSK
jgi:hypothetical protein